MPPVLPPGFRPYHGFCPSALASTSVSSALAHALTSSRGHMVQEKPQQAGRHQMDISQRRALLGEDILPSKMVLNHCLYNLYLPYYFLTCKSFFQMKCMSFFECWLNYVNIHCIIAKLIMFTLIVNIKIPNIY